MLPSALSSAFGPHHSAVPLTPRCPPLQGHWVAKSTSLFSPPNLNFTSRSISTGGHFLTSLSALVCFSTLWLFLFRLLCQFSCLFAHLNVGFFLHLCLGDSFLVSLSAHFNTGCTLEALGELLFFLSYKYPDPRNSDLCEHFEKIPQVIFNKISLLRTMTASLSSFSVFFLPFCVFLFLPLSRWSHPLLWLPYADDFSI